MWTYGAVKNQRSTDIMLKTKKKKKNDLLNNGVRVDDLFEIVNIWADRASLLWLLFDT